MIVFFNVAFLSLMIILIGWTIITYFMKEDSQKLIKQEIGNMFEITQMFLVSMKSLIQLLIKASFNSNLSDESKEIDDQLLKFVPKTSGNQDENKAA